MGYNNGSPWCLSGSSDFFRSSRLILYYGDDECEVLLYVPYVLLCLCVDMWLHGQCYQNGSVHGELPSCVCVCVSNLGVQITSISYVIRSIIYLPGSRHCCKQNCMCLGDYILNELGAVSPSPGIKKARLGLKVVLYGTPCM